MNPIVTTYIIISLIWLVVLIISNMIFGLDLYSIGISVLFLIVYIPVANYYISRGEENKLQESLFISILLLTAYVIAQVAGGLHYTGARLL